MVFLLKMSTGIIHLKPLVIRFNPMIPLFWLLELIIISLTSKAWNGQNSVAKAQEREWINYVMSSELLQTNLNLANCCHALCQFLYIVMQSLVISGGKNLLVAKGLCFQISCWQDVTSAETHTNCNTHLMFLLLRFTRLNYSFFQAISLHFLSSMPLVLDLL